METEAYKLFKVRKDGSIGPLFINASQRIPIGEWLDAEDHPTKGFAHRPGWHATATPEAPHLSPVGRKWFKVQLQGARELIRPGIQGGTWYLADKMKVVEEA